nr:EcsC family protein [Fictibacillus macauensis]
METAQELQLELEKIKKWEHEQKDLWFWEKLGRIPFKILDKVTPTFIQNKMLQVIDELGRYVQSGGKYLIDEKAVVQRVFKSSATSYSLTEVASLPLEQLDEAATHYQQARRRFATLQGATTGIGGLFTLGLDIPMLVGLSLKTLQEIALCYGYDPNDPAERLFIIRCLQFASSDIVGKTAILNELTATDQERNREALSQIQGWREVVITYRDQFGWKKLFQLVPVAGILFGAFVNQSMIQDVAEAGRMLYRKRRILERLQTI